MNYFHGTFSLPAVVGIFLLLAFVSPFSMFYIVAIALGLAKIINVAYYDIRHGNWSLDYIAFLAMLLALISNEYVAGAVIALMYTGGEALEAYASKRAQTSLSALLARIPKTAVVKNADGSTNEVPLADVPNGVIIMVRSNELVPLDGTLISEHAVLSLANLTGESLPETVHRNALIKSGSVNVGEAFELTVVGTLSTSTYAKIVQLVADARKNPAPFVRLADKVNIPFTVLTLVLSSGAYLVTGDIARALAVLVIATPCPLIIAAPVAFVGGLSRAAGRNIIIKTPAALEGIANVTTLFFDKTGTLTLGEPQLIGITLKSSTINEERALFLASALELHSIHPLARAVVAHARTQNVHTVPATEVTETIGTGVAGLVDGQYCSIEQAALSDRSEGGISLLLSGDGTPLAVFHFADVLKEDAASFLSDLARSGMKLAVLTGDRREHAEVTFKGIAIDIHADLEPEDKYRLVDEARARGEQVAMIGDGLNDAPALARADIGIVFSGTENSAAIEAADAVILGRDLSLVSELFALAHRSVKIAGQSVYTGIGLSVAGMGVAAFGFIQPVMGAVLQEGIDVSVILNALRAAFTPRNQK